MQTKTTQDDVSAMFNEISHTYDKVNRILSFGIDSRWRKTLLKHLPEGDQLRYLDLATGTCDQLLSVLNTGRVEQAVGIDLAQEMLSIGQLKVAQAGFESIADLKVASATSIPEEADSFDCITMTFGIRNVQGDCLKEVYRVLDKGGKALILEFSLPKNRIIRALHLFYLRKILPTLGGLISRKKSAYTYLNQTIEAFPYGEAFLNLLRQAGFQKVEAHPLTLGVATLYVGTKT